MARAHPQTQWSCTKIKRPSLLAWQRCSRAPLPAAQSRQPVRGKKDCRLPLKTGQVGATGIVRTAGIRAPRRAAPQNVHSKATGTAPDPCCPNPALGRLPEPPAISTKLMVRRNRVGRVAPRPRPSRSCPRRARHRAICPAPLHPLLPVRRTQGLVVEILAARKGEGILTGRKPRLRHMRLAHVARCPRAAHAGWYPARLKRVGADRRPKGATAKAKTTS